MNQGQSISQKTNQELQPQSSSRLPLILIGFVLILAAGAGGVYLGKYLYGPKAPQISTSVTPTPRAEVLTTTPTTDPMEEWKTYTFQQLQLSLKVPPELTVHTEEPNPGRDFTAYIQNYPFNAPYPKENGYQLYIHWQKTPAVTQTEFQQLKNDLVPDSVEDTFSGGYPAIKGQAKGERNRFVTYILKNNTKISLFTAEPTEANRERTDQILSTFKFLDASVQTIVTPTDRSPADGADIKNVKYSLPQGWEATLDEKSLFISPVNGGGFLSIRVYNYLGNIGRREYYCQVSTVCMEGTTYFTDMSIGNISGYVANALDNSGGGPEYFGAKGNKFYIISSYSPPSPNEFEKNYRNVLDSLRF